MKGSKQGWMLRMIGAAALGALALPAAATDYTVDTAAEPVITAGMIIPDGQLSLREAVMAASSNAAVGDAAAGEADGDTIDLGDFDVTLVAANGPLSVTDDVSISGTGSIDGGGAVRILSVDATGETVAISGITLTNGIADTGAALLVSMGSTVTLDNVDVTDNVGTGTAATNGGAIDNVGTLTITGGTFSGNTAIAGAGSGGAIHNWGTLSADGTTFDSNQAARAGGAIEQRTDAATTTLNNVTMTNNVVNGMSPAGNGGALHVSQAGDVTITGGDFSSNTTGNEGGALWNGGGTMSVTGATLSLNEALGTNAFEGGGGIFNNGGTLNVTDTDITGNLAVNGSGSGGGIFNHLGGALTVSGGTISSNVAARAGGGIETRSLDDDGTVVATVGTITLNNGLEMDSNGVGMDADDTVTTVVTAAPGNGGAFHSTGGAALVVDGITLSNNQAAQEGGGLWTGGGTSTVTDTAFTNNAGLGDDAIDGGGGLFNQGGDVTLGGSTTFDGNTALGASGSGGAILNNEGTINATGVTFTNNVANRAGGGLEDRAAMDADGSVTVTLTNISATANAAGVGDGATAAPGNGGFLHVSGNNGTAVVGGTYTGNMAALEGGALWTGAGNSTIDGAAISGNSAAGDGADDGGGGLFNQGGNVTITGDTTISDNTALGASGSGGGILNNMGTVSMTGGTISGNVANRAGGGIEDIGNSTTPNTAMNPSIALTNVTLSGNGAGFGDAAAVAAPGNGGGMHLSGANGWAVVTGGSVMSNTAALEGGGLWNSANGMDISGTTVSGNVALGTDADTGGGGLFNNGGMMRVTDATIVLNTATQGSGSGGGLLSDGGSVTIATSTFSDNSTARAGGAIEIRSAATLSVTDSTLDGNDAGPTPGNGGGVHVSGPDNSSTFFRTTVSNNTAANEGGGLWNFDDSTMMVDNSTVFGNTANGDPGGGGIFNRPASTTLARNTTIAGNMAPNGPGGGVANADATASFVATNTLIGNNTAASNPDLSGAITDGDYNLVEDTTGATLSGDNNVTGMAPGVAAMLADNGGPTLTAALAADSPAVDAGLNATCASDVVGGTDQRGPGFVRPSPADGDCDIGAFELTANPVVVASGNGQGSNAVVTADSGAQNVPGVGFSLAAPAGEAVTVSGFSGAISTSSANLSNDLSNLDVYLDVNGNGAIDAADSVITGATVTVTGGASPSFTASFSPARTVAAGTTESYILAADFSTNIAALALPMLAGGSLLMLGMIGGLRRRKQLMLIGAVAAVGFLAGCDSASDINVVSTAPGDPAPSDTASFQFTVNDVDADGATTGLAVQPDGLPITGPTIRVTESAASN